MKTEGQPNQQTRIVFADRGRSVTIGQVKAHYHGLLGRWHTGSWEQLLDNMLVCVRKDGLDWYARELLEGPEPPQAAVFGHTHHGEMTRFGSRNYGNDGCWCNSPKHSKPTFIQLAVTPDAIDVALAAGPA